MTSLIANISKKLLQSVTKPSSTLSVFSSSFVKTPHPSCEGELFERTLMSIVWVERYFLWQSCTTIIFSKPNSFFQFHKFTIFIIKQASLTLFGKKRILCMSKMKKKHQVKNNFLIWKDLCRKPNHLYIV